VAVVANVAEECKIKEAKQSTKPMINKLPRSYSRHPAVINTCAGVGRAK
jgi:hypothetical protein